MLFRSGKFPTALINSATSLAGVMTYLLQKTSGPDLTTVMSQQRSVPFEILKRLRAEGVRTPIILVSISDDALAQGCAAGADAVVNKSTIITSLPEALRKLDFIA